MRLLGLKPRPVLILSTDRVNRYRRDMCVVPFTTVQRSGFTLWVPVHAPDGGLERDSWAKCDQVHTVEKRELFFPPLGRLAPITLHHIENAVRTALEL